MTQRSATVVLTIRAEGRDPAGTQPALVFTRSEHTYQLSQIWESPSDGRELTAPSGTRHVRAVSVAVRRGHSDHCGSGEVVRSRSKRPCIGG